jgi:hypothetical protein
MNRLLVLFSVLSVLCVGCQDDSDYRVGTYHVTITKKLSSCPDEIFAFFEDPILSATALEQHPRPMVWQIDRIGITGSGADTIVITMELQEPFTEEWLFTGALERDVVHVENRTFSRDDSCGVAQTMNVYGILERSHISGEVHSIFSLPPGQAECAEYFQPFQLCEITQTFFGVVADEQI